jgi:hypothetical protein
VPRRKGNYVKKLIRFPDDLEQEIAVLAERDYRPFTAQVVKMLREWLEANRPIKEGKRR